MNAVIISLALLCSTIEGKVVAIADGDTLTVLSDSTQIKVRLDGIDAPERRQAFGTQAREKLAEFAFGKTVKVETKGKDRYGRTIGVVLVDGVNVNARMIECGLAWHYKTYSKDEGLAKAENEARAAKRGLWADPEPIAPWDFRKRPPAKKAA